MTDPHRKTTSRRRLLRPAVLAMAVVLAAVTGWFTYRTTFAEAADSGFVTARVTRGDIQETVLASGILKPSRLVAVCAQVSGRPGSLEGALGDKVAPGGLAAEIDSVNKQHDLKTGGARRRGRVGQYV